MHAGADAGAGVGRRWQSAEGSRRELAPAGREEIARQAGVVWEAAAVPAHLVREGVLPGRLGGDDALHAILVKFLEIMGSEEGR